MGDRSWRYDDKKNVSTAEAKTVTSSQSADYGTVITISHRISNFNKQNALCNAMRLKVNKLKFVPELEKTGREYFQPKCEIKKKKGNGKSVIFGIRVLRTLISTVCVVSKVLLTRII